MFDLALLLIIPIAFIIVAYLPWRICAICAAVSITWLTMLVLWLLNYPVSELAIGILMGMSVSGLMYKLVPIYKKAKIRSFWFVRLVLVLGGFGSIYFLLNQDWNKLILTLIISLISGFIATVFFSGKDSKRGENRLENCC